MRVAHCLAAFLGMTAVAGASNAAKFMAESINYWGNCDATCSTGTTLHYTDDQAQMFVAEMNDGGHTNLGWYHNQDVWSSDIKDDHFNGQDDVYGDQATIYLYSGHGKTFQDAAGNQRFRAPMCRAGTSASCRANSDTMLLGERSGPFAAKTGNIRWVVLATCYSVHTKPNEQWGSLFRYGTDMIFGYRGLSADGETTDEVPEDFAEVAFNDDDRFKPSWFWAIEDWWVDDTGSFITAGMNKEHAHHRRDQMRNSWSRRPAAEIHTWRTWSWHEG